MIRQTERDSVSVDMVWKAGKELGQRNEAACGEKKLERDRELFT